MERATRGETLSFGSSQRTRGPPWPSSSGTTTASVDDADEEAAQMRAAIAASLGEDVGGGAGGYAAVPAGRGGAQLEELGDLAAALVASTAGSTGGAGVASSSGAVQWGYAGGADEDADLRAAIAASLATDPSMSPPASSAPQQLQQEEEGEVVPVPPQPDAGEEGVIQLAVRLPTGARFVRRFHSSTSLKVGNRLFPRPRPSTVETLHRCGGKERGDGPALYQALLRCRVGARRVRWWRDAWRWRAG